jgi:adenine/guanine phosphoribosyltransferase-like PRPP-binding protein
MMTEQIKVLRFGDLNHPDKVNGERFKSYQSRLITGQGMVGTELKRSLSWVDKIKPEDSNCSCANLMKEMNLDGIGRCIAKRDSYYIPRLMTNRDTISEEMKAERGWKGVLGLAAGMIPDMLMKQWLKIKFNQACERSKVGKKTIKPRGQKSVRGAAGFASAFRSGKNPVFITASQFQDDIKSLIGLIPDDVTAIAGVARSGLSAATMLSMYTHLPMMTIRQTMNDIVATGNGWRLGDNNHLEPDLKKVLVVDDTCMSGNSLRTIKPLLDSKFKNYLTATVYCNPTAIVKPDIFAKSLAWPHLLEWNLFNSVLSPNMAIDFDGILCHDCPRGSDDDGERYLDFILNAKPLYPVRRSVIPLIVTARIERYREETIKWLDRYNIKVKKLVMHPAETLAQRNQDNIPAYKASHFKQWAKRHVMSGPPPLGFIESDDHQAQSIAKLSRLMVICPASGKVY